MVQIIELLKDIDSTFVNLYNEGRDFSAKRKRIHEALRLLESETTTLKLGNEESLDRAKNELTLKWGTLKSYGFEDKRSVSLLKEYDDIQNETAEDNSPRQREIICELIDLCDGDTIYLHYGGKYVSKSEAKAYVMNYERQYKAI